MKRPLLLAALLLTIGVLIIDSRTQYRDRWLLHKPAERTALERSYSGYMPVSLKGTLLWAEEKNGNLVFRVYCGRSGGTVLVYIPMKDGEISSENILQLIGSPVRISGTAFLFQPAENPGQFDVRRYYDNLGIWYGVSQAEIWTDTPKTISLRRCMFRLASALRARIVSASDPESRDLLLSQAFGVSSPETDALKEKADALSAVQLISMSGFLISSVGMLIYRFMRKHFRNLFLCAFIPFLMVLLYHAVLGSPLSMIRSMIVFGLRVLAPSVKRRFDTLSAASLSVLLLGLCRPTMLLLPSVSFYLAVLVSQGIICEEVRRAFFRHHFFATVFLSFFSMQACLLPVQIMNRYAWSPYGMILVCFMMPVRTFSVILILFGAFTGLFLGQGGSGVVRALLFLPSVLAKLCQSVLSAYERFPFHSVITGTQPFFRFLIYGLLLISVPVFFSIRESCARRKKNKKEKKLSQRALSMCAGFYLLMIVFGAFLFRPADLSPDETVYSMLSVGQGDCGLLRTQDLVLGVDSGSSDREDAGEIFSDACRYYGIRRIDLMTLSHGDMDHTNGIGDILSTYGHQINEVWIPDVASYKEEFAEELEMLRSYGMPVRLAGAGDQYTYGETRIKVLSPKHGAPLQGNDCSLVLLVTHFGRSVLFTGDISSELENTLRFPEEGIDILKVPHHGSRFSSGENMIRKTDPALALVSYGRNNSYGHPAEETVLRYHEAGIPLFGTGKSGALETHLTDTEIRISFYGNGTHADEPIR